MAKGKKQPMSKSEKHRETFARAAAAGASGDDFLQYLYGLALSHMEEMAGRKDNDGSSDEAKSPADPTNAKR